jgi:twinkle protein
LRRKHTPQIVPGELTIVTGIPNSGKSEWIDALLCNLSEAEGWSFALCSMEKKVR